MYWANTATIFFVWKKTIVEYVIIYTYIYIPNIDRDGERE